ncbi:max dimerization protein 3-like [Procambarus clarkii]|uniref:max dimerization protein 3-like n=1 Tax=Procambarus clarkii TaxID=6728 RepID=UPI0037433F28
MSLAVLLQAAEYIERREREMEHGYASTLPMPDHYRYSKSSKRSRSKSKLQSNRTTHNELEKNSVTQPALPSCSTEPPACSSVLFYRASSLPFRPVLQSLQPAPLPTPSVPHRESCNTIRQRIA